MISTVVTCYILTTLKDKFLKNEKEVYLFRKILSDSVKNVRWYHGQPFFDR